MTDDTRDKFLEFSRVYCPEDNTAEFCLSLLGLLSMFASDIVMRLASADDEAAEAAMDKVKRVDVREAWAKAEALRESATRHRAVAEALEEIDWNTIR